MTHLAQSLEHNMSSLMSSVIIIMLFTIIVLVIIACEALTWTIG